MRAVGRAGRRQTAFHARSMSRAGRHVASCACCCSQAGLHPASPLRQSSQGSSGSLDWEQPIAASSPAQERAATIESGRSSGKAAAAAAQAAALKQPTRPVRPSNLTTITSIARCWPQSPELPAGGAARRPNSGRSPPEPSPPAFQSSRSVVQLRPPLASRATGCVSAGSSRDSAAAAQHPRHLLRICAAVDVQECGTGRWYCPGGAPAWHVASCVPP